MKPLPHQIEKSKDCLEIINNIGMCYLQGLPRSGKTLTSILVAEQLEDVKNILVLTKKNAISGWEKFNKLMTKTYKITNYEQIGKLNKEDYDFVIIDESHNLSAFPKPSGRTKLIKDLGMRFMTEKSSRKYRYGLYECQYCNKEFEGSVYSVKRGQTKSCGCLSGEKHGLHQNKFYQTWYNMTYRCSNPKSKDYKDYGARGITVCEEWLDVRNFVAWCESTHPNIEGYTLDRIDNDKGYSPENCRWVDRTTQNTNQRMREDNTSGVKGVCYHKSIGKWVASIGVESKLKHIGSFKTLEEAVQARDNYIIENKLPNKLSTEY